MRLEAEDLRKMPMHIQEQVGVALAEQMEGAAPAEEDAATTSGLAVAAIPQHMSYGDHIRSLNDAQLADFLVELQIKTIRNTLENLEISGGEEWKRDLSERLSTKIMD